MSMHVVLWGWGGGGECARNTQDGAGGAQLRQIMSVGEREEQVQLEPGLGLGMKKVDPHGLVESLKKTQLHPPTHYNRFLSLYMYIQDFVAITCIPY